MPTIEIAGFPLSPDVDDPASEATTRVQEWSESITKQEGHQESWYGTVEEKKAWDSTLRRPDYKAVTDRISTIFARAGHMHHIDFEPYNHLAEAMSPPIAEIATFYFDNVPPDGYLDRLHSFCEAAMEAEGAETVASYFVSEGVGALGRADNGNLASIDSCAIWY